MNTLITALIDLQVHKDVLLANMRNYKENISRLGDAYATSLEGLLQKDRMLATAKEIQRLSNVINKSVKENTN